ncbi:hypothetical protein HPB52_001676 [Rhipicephalus sanguineus]|uniref:Uncharacterized protein n=1 Tax=Rhipicephalus sanguineus TaxID=34632 RepID=A0A9D4PTQ9_RHISA|nr:hypothetical protein HPB52_001676 [Rhipicephalus sanguineus]
MCLRRFAFFFDMASPIPPPSFLSSPGDPPITWSDWKLIFQAYADAAGADGTKPERRKALLLNSLGQAGLKVFYTVTAANATPSPFSTSISKMPRATISHARKPVADFIAASCGFGALESDMIRHQLFTGVASQNVRCRLLQKGSSISLSEALSIAREDEFIRSQLEQFAPHSVQQLWLLGPKAAVLCFTGRANMAALLLRLGAAVNTAACLHSLSVAANMAAPPLRGGEEAVKMATPCRQIQSFRINTEL